ncbi:MAG: chemotaxis protein CheB [Steroidobacter sp.]
MSVSTATYRDIIVIGGSAGGLEALTVLVAGLPRDLPAAVFTVIHIPTHTPTYLHGILLRAGPAWMQGAPTASVCSGYPFEKSSERCSRLRL